MNSGVLFHDIPPIPNTIPFVFVCFAIVADILYLPIYLRACRGVLIFACEIHSDFFPCIFAASRFRRRLAETKLSFDLKCTQLESIVFEISPGLGCISLLRKLVSTPRKSADRNVTHYSLTSDFNYVIDFELNFTKSKNVFANLQFPVRRSKPSHFGNIYFFECAFSNLTIIALSILFSTPLIANKHVNPLPSPTRLSLARKSE